jgi:hypothetical protein
MAWIDEYATWSLIRNLSIPQQPAVLYQQRLFELGLR